MAMISTKLVSLAILCFLIVPNSRSASRAARVLNDKPPADGSGSLGSVGGSRPRQDGSYHGHGSPSGTTTGGGSSFVTARTKISGKAACDPGMHGRYSSCTSAEGGNP